jgi:hypothetical protein
VEHIACRWSSLSGAGGGDPLLSASVGPLLRDPLLSFASVNEVRLVVLVLSLWGSARWRWSSLSGFSLSRARGIGSQFVARVACGVGPLLVDHVVWRWSSLCWEAHVGPLSVGPLLWITCVGPLFVGKCALVLS